MSRRCASRCRASRCSRRRQFSGSDPNGAGAIHRAEASGSAAALVGSANQQKVSDIAGELAGAQVALNNAKDRHDQTNTTLAEPAAERRGRADRTGRRADPGAADEPAGDAADHRDAAADEPGQLPLSTDTRTARVIRRASHRQQKAPRHAAGLLFADGCWGSGAAEQACGDLAVDVDQRAELLGPRIVHHRDGVVHHEQADIGDVLANVASASDC